MSELMMYLSGGGYGWIQKIWVCNAIRIAVPNFTLLLLAHTTLLFTYLTNECHLFQRGFAGVFCRSITTGILLLLPFLALVCSGLESNTLRLNVISLAISTVFIL